MKRRGAVCLPSLLFENKISMCYSIVKCVVCPSCRCEESCTPKQENGGNMPKIIEITDFLAPELDVYARTTENQLLNRAEPQNALFIAESPLVIGRALDAGCRPISFLVERKHLNGKCAKLLERCGDVAVAHRLEPVQAPRQLRWIKRFLPLRRRTDCVWLRQP